MEVRIKDVNQQFSENITGLRLELESLCKSSLKAMKTFLRDKNLELNSTQHDTYHQVRSIRTNMDEESISFNQEMREVTGEGHDKIRFLRTEEVAPAMKIVLDFRARVSDLERLAVNLVLEIQEFPRQWKHTVLFHGVPASGPEDIFVLGHTVCDIISKTLGVREEVVITDIRRLARSVTDPVHPALAVTVRHFEQKQNILRRAATIRKGNFQISDNLTRTARIKMGLLSKFMHRVGNYGSRSIKADLKPGRCFRSTRDIPPPTWSSHQLISTVMAGYLASGRASLRNSLPGFGVIGILMGF